MKKKTILNLKDINYKRMYIYDDKNRLIRFKDSLGYELTYVYKRTGELWYTHDIDGVKTWYYDGESDNIKCISNNIGRNIRITSYPESSIQFILDTANNKDYYREYWDGECISMLDPSDLYEERYEYDELNRLINISAYKDDVCIFEEKYDYSSTSDTIHITNTDGYDAWEYLDFKNNYRCYRRKDNKGFVIDYLYDDNGNLIVEDVSYFYNDRV